MVLFQKAYDKNAEQNAKMSWLIIAYGIVHFFGIVAKNFIILWEH